MTVILRHRTVLSGWNGGPGVFTSYWRPGTAGGTVADATDAAARVRAFLFAIRAIFHTTILLTPARVCDALEDTTGTLQGTFAAGAPASFLGLTGGSLAPLADMVGLDWETASVINGRTLRGRSFLGPCANAVFDGAGETSLANRTLIDTSATAMLTGGATASFPVIWRRPHTASVKDPRPSYVGDSRAISAVQTRNKVFILRSRRD